jgi:hypothetical protein
VVAQIKDAITTSSTVPQIIPVAVTIAVGKLMEPLLTVCQLYRGLGRQVSPAVKLAHDLPFHTCG